MTQRPTSSGDQFSVSTPGTDPDTSGLPRPVTTEVPMASTTQANSQQAIDQAKQTASDLTDQAKQQAGQLADQAKEQVTTRLSSQKDRAADSLGSVANALRQTGQQLRDQDQVGITQYVDQAADQIERFSSYVQNRDLPEIMNEVERFARRQPTLFLGGAFVLGLLGARFLKSSSPSSTNRNYPLATQNQYTSRMYGSGYSEPTYGRSSMGTSSYATPTSGMYGTTSGAAQTGLVGTHTSDADDVNYGSTGGTRERGGTEEL